MYAAVALVVQCLVISVYSKWQGIRGLGGSGSCCANCNQHITLEPLQSQRFTCSDNSPGGCMGVKISLLSKGGTVSVRTSLGQDPMDDLSSSEPTSCFAPDKAVVGDLPQPIAPTRHV